MTQVTDDVAALTECALIGICRLAEVLKSHRHMNPIPPDQITMECMDCGRQSIGPRPATSPAEAVLYVIHCGCEVPSTRGEPFYIDSEGERIEQPKRRIRRRRN